jgi:hypothetical protein
MLKVGCFEGFAAGSFMMAAIGYTVAIFAPGAPTTMSAPVLVTAAPNISAVGAACSTRMRLKDPAKLRGSLLRYMKTVPLPKAPIMRPRFVGVAKMLHPKLVSTLLAP